MIKKPVFALKTNQGYGLLQEFDSYDYNPEYKRTMWTKMFYIIYVKQLQTLSEENIQSALDGPFYYKRCVLTMDQNEGFDVDEMMQHKGKEFAPFLKYDKTYHYKDCLLTYIGDYPLPNNAEIPKLTRWLVFSYQTRKHEWWIIDQITQKGLKDENGEIVIYKKVVPEIASYPLEGIAFPRELREDFEKGYGPDSFDDDWVDRDIIGKYYEENPHLLPSDEKYDDIKLPLPTEGWRQAEGEPLEPDYLAFAGRVEEALKAFIAALDANRRAVQKPLVKLLKELNKINQETEYIDSLEAEDLEMYISRILASLNKQSMIEAIENMRDW